MKKFLLVALLLSSALTVSAQSNSSRHNRGGGHNSGGNGAKEGAQPGDFQFYLLTLSWSPEFCLTPAGRGKSECATPHRFVMHGLWPQIDALNYPADCSTAAGPSNPAQYKDVYPDQGLLGHEWSKHGTCSGLGPDAYFAAARQAFNGVAIPAQLANGAPPPRMMPDAILAAFQQANPGAPAGAFVMSCGANRLTAVSECLDKDLKPIACVGVKSCGANGVGITAPGGSH